MVSAYSSSGQFLVASVFADAVWRYRVLRLQFWVMDHAALACGSGTRRINPVDLQNGLRKIQTDRGNFAHRTAPT